MSPVRTRVVGCAVALATAAALSGCGGGGGNPATPVSTPAGVSPASTAQTTPQTVASNAAPVAAVAPAAPSAAASGRGGPSPTGAATPGGQNDTATLNQIDTDLSNVDGSLSTTDSVRAQETS
jgi:hypothetical protein